MPGSIQPGVCVTSRQSMFALLSQSFIPPFTIHSCRNPDAYHTAYCISGLSAAQHHVCPSSSRREEVRAAWQGEEGVRATAFAECLCWVEEEGGSYVVGSAANRVVSRYFAYSMMMPLLRKSQNATHPLFNLTMTHTEGIMAHFYKQTVPKRTPRPTARS